MTQKISFSHFFKNNWDEFVHLRALRDIAQQIDDINAQQDSTISQAQSAATNAKNEADEASQNAVNAVKIGEMASQTATQAETVAQKAQDTASELGTQVAQLDGEVLKKQTDGQEFFKTLQATEMNGKNVLSAVSDQANLYHLYTTTGKLIQSFEGSVDFTSDNDLSQSSAMQVTLSDSLPDLGWLGGRVTISDSKSNVVSFNGGIQVNDNGFRVNFDTLKSDINSLVGPYHVVIIINDLRPVD